MGLAVPDTVPLTDDHRHRLPNPPLSSELTSNAVTRLSLFVAEGRARWQVSSRRQLRLSRHLAPYALRDQAHD